MNDFIYLLACALHDRKPEHIEEMDLDTIQKQARFHSVMTIIAYALKEKGNEWQQIYDGNVRRNMVFRIEREKLLGFLEKNKILYMPLKGIVIMDLYPGYGMRKMADNDILIEASHAGEVRQYMIGQGYECVSFGKSNHDIYHKKPFLNFELHTSLYGRGHLAQFVEYYQDLSNKWIKDKDREYGRHMNDNDFYVYVCSHAYKHFSNSGTGVRTLCDDYVMRHGLCLDMEYVMKEARKLKIEDFVMQVSRMSEGLFADPDNMIVSEEDKEALSFILRSGTYGTVENRVKKKLHEMDENVTAWTKAMYIFDRIFPDDEYFKNFPFYERHRMLRPFFIVYRLGRTIAFGGKRIVSEFRAVRKA